MEPETEKSDPRSVSSVDKGIGARIRARRTELGMSQETLAGLIGVTFQQVQKYEKGVNRVSASTLFAIARALEARVTAFYPQSAHMRSHTETLTLDTPELAQLASIIWRLNHEGHATLRSLAQALVNQQSLQKGPPTP